MDIAKQYHAKYITLGSVIVAAGTILTCLSAEVALGQVSWPLMISDLGVHKPWSYVFRLGIIFSGPLLFVNSLLMFFYLNASTAFSQSTFAVLSSKVAVTLCAIGCLCLSIVGDVNEDENNAVHSTAAVIFFVTELIMMFVYVHRLNSDPMANKSSIAFKYSLASASSVIIVLFAFFATNWGRWATQIAICEWTGTAIILLYNLSFLVEFRDVYVGELFRAPLPPSHQASSQHVKIVV